MNTDYEVEKRNHTENFEENINEEPMDILDQIEWLVQDLSKWSVYHEDKLNSETSEFEELIKKARRNL